MTLQPFLGPWPLFSVSWSYTQSVGLLGRGISPSRGRFLYTEQHKHRLNIKYRHLALSWIRTHDPSVRAGEDISCLRPRGHCDGPSTRLSLFNSTPFEPVKEHYRIRGSPSILSCCSVCEISVQMYHWKGVT
jgi:hypothetical protein